jgi:transposase-like protein
MPECSRCHQPVTRQAITCPHCGNTLKAHGHPGIPLHQATGQEPLCQTCLYHRDDSCTYPKRPYAMDCTLYSTVAPLANASPASLAPFKSGYLKNWMRRHGGLVALVGLLLLSLCWVLLR